MAGHSSNPSAHAPLPEQEFVDAAYARLDELRESYRKSQGKVHATHGVNNAQAWTEREALSAHLGDMAARLEGVEDRLVFGRLDMNDGQVRRIGRVALSAPSGPPLLIDWRAPAAMPFYQATAVAPLDVARRRHITTRHRTVVAIEDELLDSQAGSQLDLHGEGALMAVLTQARDGRMGDIVATIQSEQDQIVRAKDEGIIVVQGGPGTGKTAVALHRIAYLLYAQRERLQRSGVLLVGPSRIFLRYIEKVLPSLGETGVVATTLGDLLPGIHATAFDPVDVAEAKGHPGWVRLLAQAVKSLPRTLSTPVHIRVWNHEVELDPSDVATAIRNARRSHLPHNQARTGFALELMERLAFKLALDAGEDHDGEVSKDTINTWMSDIRDSIDARRAINLAWMPTSATTLLSRLYARPDLLASLNTSAGRPLPASALNIVARKSSSWTPADIPLLDELEELLGPLPTSESSPRRTREAHELDRARAAIEGQGLGGGIVTAEQLAQLTRGEGQWAPLGEQAAKDRQWAYGHIVVDEAQDLSPMAWHCLLRRCPSRSMTIVGDLDQRRGTSIPSSWKDALAGASRALSAEYVLTVSYRTPKTLTDLAMRVMARNGQSVAHPLTAVREVEDAYRVEYVDANDGDVRVTAEGDEAPDALKAAAKRAVDNALERLDRDFDSESGRVGVIVSSLRAQSWNADVTGLTSLESRVCVLSAVAAKGLEFDTVILIEPGEILAEGPGDLFVALTRSTHDLVVIHSKDLPAGMEEW